jgi:hypothetical protein
MKTQMPRPSVYYDAKESAIDGCLCKVHLTIGNPYLEPNP